MVAYNARDSLKGYHFNTPYFVEEWLENDVIKEDVGLLCRATSDNKSFGTDLTEILTNEIYFLIVSNYNVRRK
jgi:hypothetical protein